VRDAEVLALREVLAMLVERVEPTRVKLGRYRIEVTWTPLGEALHLVARGLREAAA
jgi:hypothetical protein